MPKGPDGNDIWKGVPPSRPGVPVPKGTRRLASRRTRCRPGRASRDELAAVRRCRPAGLPQERGARRPGLLLARPGRAPTRIRSVKGDPDASREASDPKVPSLRPVSAEQALAMALAHRGSGVIDPTRTATDPARVEALRKQFSGPGRAGFNALAFMVGRPLAYRVPGAMAPAGTSRPPPGPPSTWPRCFRRCAQPGRASASRVRSAAVMSSSTLSVRAAPRSRRKGRSASGSSSRGHGASLCRRVSAHARPSRPRRS